MPHKLIYQMSSHRASMASAHSSTTVYPITQHGNVSIWTGGGEVCICQGRKMTWVARVETIFASAVFEKDTNVYWCLNSTEGFLVGVNGTYTTHNRMKNLVQICFGVYNESVVLIALYKNREAVIMDFELRPYDWLLNSDCVASTSRGEIIQLEMHRDEIRLRQHINFTFPEKTRGVPGKNVDERVDEMVKDLGVKLGQLTVDHESKEDHIENEPTVDDPTVDDPTLPYSDMTTLDAFNLSFFYPMDMICGNDVVVIVLWSCLCVIDIKNDRLLGILELNAFDYVKDTGILSEDEKSLYYIGASAHTPMSIGSGAIWRLDIESGVRMPICDVSYGRDKLPENLRLTRRGTVCLPRKVVREVKMEEGT